MESFNLRRFSKPEVLKKMNPCLLLALLDQHRLYFAARRLELPETDEKLDLDYQKLAHILLVPDPTTPPELAKALSAVDQLSAPKGQEALEAIVGQVPLSAELGSRATAADIAVQCWLDDRGAVDQALGELRVSRKRSFLYFQPSTFPLRPLIWTEESRQGLEAELEDWFVAHRKGRGVRVISGSLGDETWFEVRRGDSFHREGSLENGESKSVLYRPEKYDVLVYDPTSGAIRVNVKLVGEKHLYRRAFSKHLFGQETYFAERGRYTLEPLRRDRESSLFSEDVADVELVVLTELHLYFGGDWRRQEILRATDVFAAFGRLNERFAKRPKLTRAVLEVKFSDNEKARKVTISPPDRLAVSQDGDCTVVDEWLIKRGFASLPPGATDAEA